MSDFLKETAANGLGSLAAAIIVRIGESILTFWRNRKVAGKNPPQIGAKDISEEHSLPTITEPPGNVHRENQQAKTKKNKLSQVLCSRYALIFVYTFTLISLISAFTPLKITDTLVSRIFKSTPDHEKWIAEAWDAMDHDNPTQAIGAAEKIIDKYADDAEGAEEELERNQPLPPEGPLDGDERKRVFARGPLNDVATAYWIAGQAYEQLGNFPKACENYRATARLRYARTWDPTRWAFRGLNFGGQFWSPAAKAAGRVQRKCGGNPNH
jgi:tetratricopeptide (TPR) repeat protein